MKNINSKKTKYDNNENLISNDNIKNNEANNNKYIEVNRLDKNDNKINYKRRNRKIENDNENIKEINSYIESKTKHHYLQKQSPDKKDDLSESRIITKNLVYVIGLSASLANKEKLIKYEYFGQYGTIIKIVVNKNKI